MYLIEPIRNGEWIYNQGLLMAIQSYARDHLFLDDDIVFPYMPKPSVQIGLFQNAYEEVNLPFLEEHNMDLVRRETGGGAIYLDDKNMSFCFLLDSENHSDVFGNYAKLYEPVIRALEKLGVKNIEQKGRNDLTLNGQKISGAAMTIVHGRIYAGYSLLLDPDFETMEAVLTPNYKKISSHGIKSVRARVGSLRQALREEDQNIDVWELTDYLLRELLQVDDLEQAKRYVLSEKDWKAIDEIAAKTYNNWDWNYGRFKNFDYQVNERIEGVGTLHIGLSIQNAKIYDIQISGDFFSIKSIQELEELLRDTRLKQSDLLAVLENIDLSSYISRLDNETFINLLLNIPKEENCD